MRKAPKLLLFVVGVGLATWLLSSVGPARVWSVIAPLGWAAPLLLCPYGLVYVVDTLGWRLTFGRQLPPPMTFLQLVRIRWAGESVNTLVPSGYIGGEAVKVYLLHRAGVSGWAGTTSAVVSKTVQTVAQVLFIGLGAVVGATHLPPHSPLRPAMWAVTGLAAALVLILIALQRQGFFRSLDRVASVWRHWRAWFLRHRDRIREVDDRIRSFHRDQPGWLVLSAGAYFAGWLCDTLEILLVSALLGWGLDWPRALTIEAFIGVAKALGMVVPGSLGVQESGVVLLFRAFGLDSSQALAYALLRRARELVFALVGLGLLWATDAGLKRLRVELSQDRVVSS